FQRRTAAPGRMIGNIERCVPERHDGVADELVDRAQLRLDGVRQWREQMAHEFDQLLGAELFRNRREVANIHEHQRQRPPHAAATRPSCSMSGDSSSFDRSSGARYWPNTPRTNRFSLSVAT